VASGATSGHHGSAATELTIPVIFGILAGMTMMSDWLNTGSRLVPGTEIFRAERTFQLWAHTVSHSQTLLRSTLGRDRRGRDYGTRLDVLFKPVEAMKIRNAYDDLVIRVATTDETSDIRSQAPGVTFHRDTRVFLLESAGEADYVIASAVGWHEDTLDFGEPSHFTVHDPDTPAWARTPLGCIDGGLGGNVATAGQLINALLEAGPEPVNRELYRYIYVLMVRLDTGISDPRIFPGGAFLSKAEAEDAQGRLTPKADQCWIESVPIGI
jgi:hypothetical protein